MKKKLLAGVMAVMMMVSVMSTGVFAEDFTNLDPSDEAKRAGNTEVTATVEENTNKASYIIRIPNSVDFGTIQQPETDGNAYSYKDITVSCEQAENLESGQAIAVLVKDETAKKQTDSFRLTNKKNPEYILNYEIMNKDVSIQNNTWYDNGFLFNTFTAADQSATDQLRLNRNQLYNKNISVWGGQYTGTLNFYTKIVDVHAY